MFTEEDRGGAAETEMNWFQVQNSSVTETENANF